MEGSLERRAARVVGGRQPRARRRAAPPAAWPRRTAPAPRAPCARPRCRCTAASATRGSASSTCTCAGRCSRRSGSATTATQLRDAGSASGWGRPMDFRDSPAEAEFRARLRAWLAEQQPRPADVVDRRRVLGPPGRVAHRALRRRVLRAELAGALRRPRSADGVRRHPRRGARGRGRAAAPEPRLPRAGHLDARQRGDQGPVPSRPDQRPRALVPGLQRARRRLRPRVVAHDRDARRRRVRDRRPQDLDELLRRRRLVLPPRAHRSRRPEAQGPLGVRGADATSPGSSNDRCG